MRFYEKQFENNFEEMITYYPRFYRDVYEMVEILKANGRVFDRMEKPRLPSRLLAIWSSNGAPDT